MIYILQTTLHKANLHHFFSFTEQSKSKFHPPAAATATSATSPAATPTTTAAASLRRNGPVDGSPHTKIPEPASGESATSGGQPAAASGRTESHVRVDEQRPVAEPHPTATAIDQFTSAAPTADSTPAAAAAAAAASDVQLDAQSNWSPIDGGGSGQCG